MRSSRGVLAGLGATAVGVSLCLASVGSPASATGSVRHDSAFANFEPQAIAAPLAWHDLKGSTENYCTLPNGTTIAYIHCYDPSQIAAAYGLDTAHADGLEGQGQTIVLVDSYGSPTAASDLDHFAEKFGLPKPDFTEIYPLGKPNYTNANGSGLSGPSAAASWSGEATLDIEWSFATAPRAHIVLLAVPPAETLGVQGLPNMFKAISWAVAHEPDGTIFSQSFGLTEQSLEAAGPTQVERFDAVYENAALGRRATPK